MTEHDQKKPLAVARNKREREMRSKDIVGNLVGADNVSTTLMHEGYVNDQKYLVPDQNLEIMKQLVDHQFGPRPSMSMRSFKSRLSVKKMENDGSSDWELNQTESFDPRSNRYGRKVDTGSGSTTSTYSSDSESSESTGSTESELSESKKAAGGSKDLSESSWENTGKPLPSVGVPTSWERLDAISKQMSGMSLTGHYFQAILKPISGDPLNPTKGRRQSVEMTPYEDKSETPMLIPVGVYDKPNFDDSSSEQSKSRVLRTTYEEKVPTAAKKTYEAYEQKVPSDTDGAGFTKVPSGMYGPGFMPFTRSSMSTEKIRFLISGHIKDHPSAKPIFIIHQYNGKSPFQNEQPDFSQYKSEGNIKIDIDGKFYKDSVLKEENNFPKSLDLKPEKIKIDIDSRSKVFETEFSEVFRVGDHNITFYGQFIKSLKTGKYTPFFEIQRTGSLLVRLI